MRSPLRQTVAYRAHADLTSHLLALVELVNQLEDRYEQFEGIITLLNTVADHFWYLDQNPRFKDILLSKLENPDWRSIDGLPEFHQMLINHLWSNVSHPSPHPSPHPSLHK